MTSYADITYQLRLVHQVSHESCKIKKSNTSKKRRRERDGEREREEGVYRDETLKRGSAYSMS